MMRLLVFHLLLLVMLPIVWHMLKKQVEHGPNYAGSETTGSALTDAEQDYYDTIFSYTMQNVADGKSYSWQVGKSSGSITVGPNFVSQSHSFCRQYAENYVINGRKGSTQGYACRRRTGGDDAAPGWCRLKTGDALTCALENDNSLEDIGGGSRINNFFDNTFSH